MKSITIAATLLTGALAAVAATATAADRVDFGKREYDANCAICHGQKAKGDGPYAGLLTKTLPDLTVLAKRNGGVFPLQRVYDSIEGSSVVGAHGTRDMPIWGAAYRLKAAEHYMDMPYNAETYVRARILALAEYLNRLQEK